jgi:hypothetical protein
MRESYGTRGGSSSIISEMRKHGLQMEPYKHGTDFAGFPARHRQNTRNLLTSRVQTAYPERTASPVEGLGRHTPQEKQHKRKGAQMRNAKRVIIVAVICMAVICSSAYALKENPSQPKPWIVFNASNPADFGDGSGWSDPVESPQPPDGNVVSHQVSWLQQLFGRVLHGIGVSATSHRDSDGVSNSNDLPRDRGANPR